MTMLQTLAHEERRRGAAYGRAERTLRLAPVSETICRHRQRNAAARGSHTKTRTAKLEGLGYPPGALPKCWAPGGAL